MTDLIKHEEYQGGESKVERLNNEVFVQAGNYCRAMQDIQTNIKSDYSLIRQGELLLIQKLNYAHELIHNVVVRPHPRYYANGNNPNYYHFMLEDFLDQFELVSMEDGNAIRAQEMNSLQQQIQQQQKELFAIQSNPQKMMEIAMDIYSRRIEHKDSKSPVSVNGDINVVDVIAAGITPDLIEQLKGSATQQQDIIKIQAEWLLEEQTKLQQMFARILPYGTELASAQSASMQDINRDLAKRQSGIETLELYVGSDVTLHTIKEGRSADSDIKLSVVQEVLYADVELSLHKSTAIYFDASKMHVLWKELVENPSFVNQIFPTERCIVLMRCNRMKKDYGNIYESSERNAQNKSVFLLVRNGENLYAIFSPISSHLGAARLFPAFEEIERHLFNGGNEIVINIDDLEYSSKMQQIELEILHYKRFMILIAGFDHRENLFGDFYPKQQFLTMFQPEFQNCYMNFIHDGDGEGMLPTMEEKTLTLTEWCAKLNSKLTRGSRVIVDTEKLVNNETAPACYSIVKDESRCNYEPIDHFVFTTVQQDKKGFFVKIPVKHGWDSDKREFEARVAIPVDVTFSEILCIDGMTPHGLDFYINSRLYRQDFVKYVELFKHARKHIDEQYVNHLPLITYLRDALTHIQDNQLHTEAQQEEAILATINTWQSLSSGYALLSPIEADNNPVYSNLLKQLYFRASPNVAKEWKGYAEKAVQNTPELTPLKLSVGADGKVWLYTEMASSDKLEQFEPHRFVLRNLLNVTKTGKCSIKSSSVVLINQHEVDEYAVVEWEGVEHYAQMTSSKTYEKNGNTFQYLFISYASKKDFVTYIESGKNLITSAFDLDFNEGAAKDLVDAYIYEEQRQYKVSNNQYADPKFTFPIAYAAGTLYVFKITNTLELVRHLVRKYNLNDYIDDKHDVWFDNLEQDSPDYKLKFQVASAPIRAETNKHIVRDYRHTFKYPNALCCAQYEGSIISTRNALSLKGKYQGSQLLSYYVAEIFRDTNRSIFTRRNANYTSAQQMRDGNYFSSFDLEDFVAFREFKLDDIVKNPAYTPELKFISVGIHYSGEVSKMNNQVVSSSLTVIVAEENLFNEAWEDFLQPTRKLAPSNTDVELVKGNFSVEGGLVLQSEVELYFQQFLERFKEKTSYFGYISKEDVQVVNALKVNSLHDLRLVSEHEGVTILSN